MIPHCYRCILRCEYFFRWHSHPTGSCAAAPTATDLHVPALSSAAQSHVVASHGHLCSRNHRNTPRCPPSAASRHRHLHPTGSCALAPTATPPGTRAAAGAHRDRPLYCSGCTWVGNKIEALSPWSNLIPPTGSAQGRPRRFRVFIYRWGSLYRTSSRTYVQNPVLRHTSPPRTHISHAPCLIRSFPSPRPFGAWNTPSTVSVRRRRRATPEHTLYFSSFLTTTWKRAFSLPSFLSSLSFRTESSLRLPAECPKRHAAEAAAMFPGVDMTGLLVVPTCQVPPAPTPPTPIP